MANKNKNASSGTSSAGRLFFALWPDDMVRQELLNRLRSLPDAKGAKRIVPENLHITLSFLGHVNKEPEICVRNACTDIDLPSFPLELDKLVYRRKQGMVWLEPAHTPKDLVSLAASIESVCRNCGIEIEDRPYKAHLTLMRKVKSFSQTNTIEPLIWQINSFVLVSSQTLPEGAVYQVIERWPLASGAVNQDN